MNFIKISLYMILLILKGNKEYSTELCKGIKGYIYKFFREEKTGYSELKNLIAERRRDSYLNEPGQG